MEDNTNEILVTYTAVIDRRDGTEPTVVEVSRSIHPLAVDGTDYAERFLLITNMDLYFQVKQKMLGNK